MPSKTGKTYASYYKNDTAIDNPNYTGCDSTTRSLIDGAGNNTSISLSDDVLSVQPVNDDTTGTFLVKNSGGDTLFVVDSINSVVKCNAFGTPALTQYQYFSSTRLVCVANAHMVLALGSASYAGHLTEWNLGTGANPATTLDLSAEADSNMIVTSYWYLPDGITVDAVHVLMGGDSASSADNLNFQLYSYALDTSTNFGDLSDGTLVAGTVGAGGSFTSDVHQDAIKYQTLANVPTDIVKGRVILATVESSGTDAISANITVKYHIT